ncbi:MAG: DUF2971 domain-containing protein [Candidatus Thiodiazotropha taylori]
MGYIRKIYSTQPTKPLFHYTTLQGLTGIVESSKLWATNVFYLNDASEVKHAASLLKLAIDKKLQSKNDNKELLTQLSSWLTSSHIERHQFFVSSFTEQSNLLSQWRGYSKLGQGVSIGLSHELMIYACAEQDFTIVKCIYEKEEKENIIREFLNRVLREAQEMGPNKNTSQRHPSQSYYDIFEMFEAAFLEIASSLKHPSFKEEEEWRFISPLITDLTDSRIKYRVANSTLIPYMEFHLPKEADHLLFHEVVIGPTQSMNLSMMSIPNYLRSKKVKCENGICNSQLPYRGL